MIQLRGLRSALALIVFLLAACTDNSEAADTSEDVAQAVAVSSELMREYEQAAADVLAAECMARAGFDYPAAHLDRGPPTGGRGGPDGDAADRQAWGRALFGSENDVITVADSSGKPIVELLAGGCLGRARQEVSSRQDWILLTQLRWETESLASPATSGVLPFGLGPRPDVSDDAQDLLSRLEEVRERITSSIHRGPSADG